MKIKPVGTYELYPTSPFNFDATFHKPAHFPSGDNFWQPGIRWQTWFWQGKQLGLKFENIGSVETPKINLQIYSAKKLDSLFLDSLRDECVYRYNLNYDLTGFYEKFGQDKVLGPLIRKLKGMRPGHQNSLYEYLIIGIVLQNATVRRSVSMLQALFENFGQLLEYDGKKLYCFWPPGGLTAVGEADLRALKIGYRAKFIKKIDDQFAAGLIDESKLREADLATQKGELIKFYGVGPATVWYLLFDVFHRYNFFEHISPWEQKIYSKLFFNANPENPVPVVKLLSYFKKYGEYRQLAVHYVWEDIWWKRKTQNLPWLEKLIRI